MKGTKFLSTIVALLILLLVSLGPGAARGPDSTLQTPLGTAFSYQGFLTKGGTPIHDLCNLQFALWDNPLTGTLVAGPLVLPDVTVTDGRFTVQIDFGNVFQGTAFWLEIGVRCIGDSVYTTLDPRQPLTAAPYALYSQVTPWDGIADMPAGFADGVDDVDDADADPANELELPPGCAGGQLVEWDGNAWVCADDNVDDADADPANELNVAASLDDSTLAITDAGGVLQVDLSSLGDDADADPANELNISLALDGATLVITDAGGALLVDLSNLIDDADADPANELNLGFALNGTTLVITDAGGGLAADLAALDTLGSLGCMAGQVAKWDSSNWVCAQDDVDDADADPTNELNSTLVLNDTTLELTDAGGTLSADLNSFQQRVTGNCPVGSTVRAVNADGSVICQPDAPLNRPTAPIANALSSLDTTGDIGLYSSITIGSDGLGLISYYDESNDDLKVAHCADQVCSSATLSTLDNTGSVGYNTSITIGADGLGLISYYDVTNGDLKVAHCADLTCSSATVSTLDSTGDVGRDTSVTIGVDGLGLISYRDISNGSLKVAHCADLACSSATVSTLDSTGDVGWHTSITIGADGLGLISYFDNTNYDLKVAHCADTACIGAAIYTLDSTGSVGGYTSIAIGADGLGLISYQDLSTSDLKVAHCANAVCTSATCTTLDSAGFVGRWTSIAIGADGLGLISYYDETDYDLKVAHCVDPACTNAIINILDSMGDVGTCTSITIGADGLGLISYYAYGFPNSSLKVAHCANAFCVPYFRRR